MTGRHVAHQPATRTEINFSESSFESDVRTAIDLANKIRQEAMGIDGWLNLPLFNETGAVDDLRVDSFAGRPNRTAYGRMMPTAAMVVRHLLQRGLAIKQARIAILGPQELLRCHVDMVAADRLLMPLNDSNTDFRHIVGESCVAMRRGELWSIHGRVCHGAANIGTSAHRVMLLIDADPDSVRPGWLGGEWSIPADRLVSRRVHDDHARAAINSLRDDEMERGWLIAPFLAKISPKLAYQELALEWSRRARPDMARYWQDHSCVCVPTPGVSNLV